MVPLQCREIVSPPLFGLPGQKMRETEGTKAGRRPRSTPWVLHGECLDSPLWSATSMVRFHTLHPRKKETWAHSNSKYVGPQLFATLVCAPLVTRKTSRWEISGLPPNRDPHTLQAKTSVMYLVCWCRLRWSLSSFAVSGASCSSEGRGVQCSGVGRQPMLGMPRLFSRGPFGLRTCTRQRGFSENLPLLTWRIYRRRKKQRNKHNSACQPPHWIPLHVRWRPRGTPPNLTGEGVPSSILLPSSSGLSCWPGV